MSNFHLFRRLTRYFVRIHTSEMLTRIRNCSWCWIVDAHDTVRARIVFDVATRLFSQIDQEMRSKFLSRVLFLYDSSVHVLSLHVCRSENVFRERTRNYLRIGSLLLHGFRIGRVRLDGFELIHCHAFDRISHLCRVFQIRTFFFFFKWRKQHSFRIFPKLRPSPSHSFFFTLWEFRCGKTTRVHFWEVTVRSDSRLRYRCLRVWHILLHSHVDLPLCGIASLDLYVVFLY